MENLKKILYMVLLWVGAFIATFCGGDKEYKERGIPVQATITKVEHGFRGRTSYQCCYLNEQGQEVYASLTLNRFDGGVGQVVEGVILPEKPGRVYCFPRNLLKYGVIVFMYAMAIIYTIFIFMPVREESQPQMGATMEYSSLDKEYSVDGDIEEFIHWSGNIQDVEEEPEERDSSEGKGMAGLKLRIEDE